MSNHQDANDEISDEDLDIALGNILDPQYESLLCDDDNNELSCSMEVLRGMEQTCEEAERVLSDYRRCRAAEASAGTPAAEGGVGEDLYDTAAKSTTTAQLISSSPDSGSVSSSDDYDFFASTLQRIYALDPTLTTLELYNPMECDLERFRDVFGDLDLCGLFSAMATLLSAARESPHIRRLDFSYITRLDNPLMRDALSRLLSCDDRYWDRLVMDECGGIGHELFAQIVSANVKSLHLTHNMLSSSCIAELGSALESSSSCCKNLRELRLTDIMTPSTMLFLAQGLIHNTTLVTLEIVGSIFADKDATMSSLAYGLRQNNGLRTLNVSRCDLQDAQVEELILSLVHHTSLTWLDVANNDCGPRGCEALATLFETGVSKVSGLTLTSCGIEDEGVTRLAQSLRHNTTLTHLHLSENAISNKGISSLAHVVLKGMHTLKTLWLMDNMFDNEGAQDLRDAIRVNVDLEQLVVDRHLQFYDEIQFFTSLNRGGRRLLAVPNAPLALWPVVLERSQRITHHFREKRVGPADILYCLLHGPVLFNNPRRHGVSKRQG